MGRQDGLGHLRPDIAVAKAWGVLGLGMTNRAIAARAADSPEFFTSVATLAGGHARVGGEPHARPRAQRIRVYASPSVLAAADEASRLCCFSLGGHVEYGENDETFCGGLREYDAAVVLADPCRAAPHRRPALSMAGNHRIVALTRALG